MSNEPSGNIAGRNGRKATVLVCRGCCCGTERKHPEVDHLAQLQRMRAAAEGSHIHFRVTDCLGACDRSNVVVLRESATTGRSTVWLGGVLASRDIDGICAWMINARHDPAPLPNCLQPLVFEPDDEARVCLERLEARPKDARDANAEKP